MRLKSPVHHLLKFLLPLTPVTNTEEVAEDIEAEPAIEVEIMEPRKSAKNRKQTKFFGSPLLYTVTYHLTPRLVPELLQHLSDTMETLKDSLVVQWNFDTCIMLLLLYSFEI